MRNRKILIYSAFATLSLMACNSTSKKELAVNENIAQLSEGVSNTDHLIYTLELPVYEDFIYDIGTRFGGIKKSELNTLRSFNDIIEEDVIKHIVTYKKISVIVLEGDKESELIENNITSNGNFSKAQLKLLQSLDYSTNILVYADYIEDNRNNGKFQNNYRSPYLTIVPETEAQYNFGKQILKKQLRDSTALLREEVDPKKLQAAKVYFTITKKGTINNVHLDRSSGYPEIDKKMIELISETGNDWKPAMDINGKKVDQELVVSFGLMGC